MSERSGTPDLWQTVKALSLTQNFSATAPTGKLCLARLLLIVFSCRVKRGQKKLAENGLLPHLSAMGNWVERLSDALHAYDKPAILPLLPCDFGIVSCLHPFFSILLPLDHHSWQLASALYHISYYLRKLAEQEWPIPVHFFMVWSYPFIPVLCYFRLSWSICWTDCLPLLTWDSLSMQSQITSE